MEFSFNFSCGAAGFLQRNLPFSIVSCVLPIEDGFSFDSVINFTSLCSIPFTDQVMWPHRQKTVGSLYSLMLLIIAWIESRNWPRMNWNYEFPGSFVLSSLCFLLSEPGLDVCFLNGARMLSGLTESFCLYLSRDAITKDCWWSHSDNYL